MILTFIFIFWKEFYVPRQKGLPYYNLYSTITLMNGISVIKIDQNRYLDAINC